MSSALLFAPGLSSFTRRWRATGLVAGLLAVPLGALLAYLMVSVVNRRSFGWTLQLDLSPPIFLQGIALAVLAALIAGAYPAWRMSRSAPALALREE